MTNMGSISDAMYAAYYDDGHPIGMPFFLRRVADLAPYDFAELLLHQMSHFDSWYVNQFILGTPFLWEPAGAALWIKILHAAPRPDTTKLIDLHHPSFCDIEFLSSTVGVDALGYLVGSEEISEAKRVALIAYFRKANSRLVPDEDADEWWDGVRYVAKDSLRKLNAELRQDFGLGEVPFDGWTVSDYVNNFATK